MNIQINTDSNIKGSEEFSAYISGLINEGIKKINIDIYLRKMFALKYFFN